MIKNIDKSACVECRLFIMSDLLTMDKVRALLGMDTDGPSRESEVIAFKI